MSTVATVIDLNRIVSGISDSEARLIGIISILEGYYNSVSKKYLKVIKSNCLEDITLSELSYIYTNRMRNNKGLHGVCWEYFIYEAILDGDDFILDIINRAINGINVAEGDEYEDIDVILWGGEKKNLNLSAISECLTDEDYLWCHNGCMKFKENLNLILESFRSEKSRKLLLQQFNSVWKADMFVKKINSNVWYAVTIKWKKSELKINLYNGLSIGMAFLDDMELDVYDEVEFLRFKNNNIKAICNIPYTYNLGQYFTDTFRLVGNILCYLNIGKNNSLPLCFPTLAERYLFDFLRKNKDYRCNDILDYLKSKRRIFTEFEKTKSVILTNTQDIVIPNSKEIITSNNIINNKIILNI